MAKERKKETLSLRQLKFVERYVVTGNATQAAKEAGYSSKNASQTSSEILKSAAVQAEIAKAREGLSEKTHFNLERAMESALEALAFAKEHKNPMAVVKSNELIFRLHGLLIDRHEVDLKGSVSMRAVLEAANSRVAALFQEAPLRVVEELAQSMAAVPKISAGSK